MKNKLLIIVLLIISITSYAQNKSIEKEQYRNAKKEQTAKVYIEYFKNYFPYGNYINKTQKLADDIVYKDAMENNNYKQLTEYKLYFPEGKHKKSINDDLENIATHNLQKLIESENYDELNKYISDHKGAEKQIEIINERIKFLNHRKEYKDIMGEKSFESFISFLKFNRKSIYYNKIETCLLNLVVEKNEISYIKKFLYINSNKEYNEKTYKLWWDIISKINSKEKYSELMANTSKENIYYKKSQIAIYDIDFLDVIQKNDIEGYKLFIKDNKDNINLDKVKALLIRKEDMIFKLAKEKNTSNAYKKYISIFPKGKFIIEAKKLLQEVSITEEKIKRKLEIEKINSQKIETFKKDTIIKNIDSQKDTKKTKPVKSDTIIKKVDSQKDTKKTKPVKSDTIIKKVDSQTKYNKI